MQAESYGYEPMIYASSVWFYSKMDGEVLSQKYPLWMSRYNSYSYDAEKDSGKERYGGELEIWQCSDAARVDGISGNVDLDWFYLDKLNGVHQASDGNWYYFVDGLVDHTYTGMAESSNGWLYFCNGKADLEYTGFAENKYGWWYMKDGQVQFGLTDVIQGIVDDTEAGWYIEDGKVTYMADERGVVRSNLWLRTPDRILLKMAEFEAAEFEDLFQQVSFHRDTPFLVVGHGWFMPD